MTQDNDVDRIGLVANRAVELGAMERGRHGHAVFAACREAGVAPDELAAIASLVGHRVTEWMVSGMPHYMGRRQFAG